jgi:muramoyltetrapeptide carboxypeptidase
VKRPSSDPYVFKLDADTAWKTIGNKPVRYEGRLLAGYIDTIRHLIGTPFGGVKTFQEKYIASWFDNTAGIIFGRTAAGIAKGGFSDLDAMERLAELTEVSIVNDAEIGHVPPQMTFVNGAYAGIEVADGKASVITKFI